MPVFLEDPSLFTKEKLRDLLVGHHVPLPQGDRKKEAYLQMYMKCVSSEQTAADFSSDEDDYCLPERNETPLNENRTTLSKMDVRTLSDSELKEQLVRNGVNPGPILPTTRFVYEKKLQQLLDQGPPVTQERQNGSGDMDRYSDSEEEDPHESRVPQRREFTMAAASNNASIFNHSKMDQRTPMGQTGGNQKMQWSSTQNSHSLKEPLKIDKNTMTYRTPTNTPKACVFVKQNRFQADDSLQKADVTDQYISSQSPLGISATRRKPIKGAAGRPIQFKYDDILTHAKLAEQAKLESGKGSARKRLPVFLQVALFAIIAFFALVFLTMENNSENPFHPYVEQGEVQLPH